MKEKVSGELYNVEVDGVDTNDYPDFCDAYISYAEDHTGRSLTEEEIDAIPDDVVYEYVINYLF